MGTLHTPHDNLFKSSMADLRVARDFFEHHLPHAVLEAIDLNELQLKRSSYVDRALRGLASDILYTVKIADKPAYLYLLCEHQSSVDPMMPFRLWQYMIGIWSDHLKQAKKNETVQFNKQCPLPLIIPMVFYHGQGPYAGPRHIRSLIEGPSALVEQLLGPFHLIDTHELADEALREQTWAGIMIFVMKHIWVRDLCVLSESLVALFRQLACQPGSSEYKATLLNYLLNIGDTAEPEVFVQTIEVGLKASKGESAMSVASRLIDIGVERGVQQGIEQGIDIGVQQGQRQERTHFLLSLLERKFGVIPNRYRTHIEKASSDQLLIWGARLLGANSLAALFEETEHSETL